MPRTITVRGRRPFGWLFCALLCLGNNSGVTGVRDWCRCCHCLNPTDVHTTVVDSKGEPHQILPSVMQPECLQIATESKACDFAPVFRMASNRAGDNSPHLYITFEMSVKYSRTNKLPDTLATMISHVATTFLSPPVFKRQREAPLFHTFYLRKFMPGCNYHRLGCLLSVTPLLPVHMMGVGRFPKSHQH